MLRRVAATIVSSRAARCGPLPRQLSTSIPVVSPRDGLPFAEIPDATAADVDAAVAAGRKCLESPWSRPDNVAERSATLRAIATTLRARMDELSRIETLDCGKPLAESASDIGFSADVFDYFADVAPRLLEPTTIELPDGDFRSRVVPAPAGVVGCITPWNFPLMQSAAKVRPRHAQALVAAAAAVEGGALSLVVRRSRPRSPPGAPSSSSRRRSPRSPASSSA